MMFGYEIKYELVNPFYGDNVGLIADGIADYLVMMAKATVPVRTGRLKGSIYVDKTRKETTPTRATRYVVAATKYAAVVEFGRVKFAPFPGRFYMRRAINMVQEYIKQYVPDLVLRGIRVRT